jgi:hypothetical protein
MLQIGVASSAQQESGILRLVTIRWPSATPVERIRRDGSGKLPAAIFSITIVCALLPGCSRTHAQKEPEPLADVRVDLNALGLPKDFFSSREELPRTIIGYRFVVWLNRDDVVVGFNTSPNKRVAPDRLVDGSARLLIFGVGGTMKTKRDIPYLAEGGQEGIAIRCAAP